jgi:hypothetical protein
MIRRRHRIRDIVLDGEILRNGWVINKDTDWQDVKQKAMTWLTSRYRC